MTWKINQNELDSKKIEHKMIEGIKNLNLSNTHVGNDTVADTRLVKGLRQQPLNLFNELGIDTI